MDRAPKLVFRTVGFVAALALGGWAFLVHTTADLCGNTVLATVPSPDGTLQAIVFERDCGATTGFSTQVSIVKEGARLSNGPGNAFVADDDHGAASAARGRGPDVTAEWRGTDTLVVQYDGRARVFHAAPRVRGITVRVIGTGAQGA